MGKLLKSANGQWHSSIATCWIVTLVSCGLCVALCIWLANELGYAQQWFGPPVRNEFYFVFMGLLVLDVVLTPIVGYLCHSRISRTAIQVHEGGIKGSSVVPKFPLSFILFGSISSLQLAEFHLTYDQVSSVDVVNEKTLLIHATGVQHKIYAMNAREVRDAIIAQKNSAK